MKTEENRSIPVRVNPSSFDKIEYMQTQQIDKKASFQAEQFWAFAEDDKAMKEEVRIKLESQEGKNAHKVC